MGTKRAFNEDLQEFIEHPKHLDYGNKSASFTDDGRKHFRSNESPESENVTVPFMVPKEFETTAPLPLVTGIGTDESDSGSVPVYCPNLFSEFFDNNFPRRPLFCYDDIYSSLMNRPPRKLIPIGPDHQADVPEFNPELARTYKINSGIERLLGVSVVGIHDSDGISHSSGISNSGGISHSDGIIHSGSGFSNCECLDGGSIRCVQQHVKEARLKLMESLGREKFVDLGMVEMGEEVAYKWSDEEERRFHEVVYLHTGSIGKSLWKQLSITFPYKTKKELVSYYFNVFILRRRAIQNRSRFLDIDSDDDEWRGGYGGGFGGVEDYDFVVGGGFGFHGDDESGSEDGGDGGSYGGGDVVVGFEEGQPEVGAKSS
ncbi:unnamed protein product [Lactuca saligna]|uniref:Myb-like domain-containing protein n=1 Tax=Lactuca saligna TaxID=75948 RepID=A0AA35YL12_LACSI|nr:unnamed protein product [Lactuca saligna]